MTIYAIYVTPVDDQDAILKLSEYTTQARAEAVLATLDLENSPDYSSYRIASYEVTVI